VPKKALQKKTPFEAWHNYTPKLTNLKTFGCLCFSHTSNKEGRMDKKAEHDNGEYP